MAPRKVTLEEARLYIHEGEYAGKRREADLLIPVPATTRWVGVWDNGNSGMFIFSSRPGDLLLSQALSVWGDQPLERLHFETHLHGDEYGPPHTATTGEWENLLNHLPNLMPTMTSEGILEINHFQNPSNTYEVLGCLTPTLPHLVAERGVRRIRLGWGVVSGRAVLAFMSTLHQEGWPVEASKEGCKVGTPSGNVDVELSKTSVVGSRTTLEEVQRLNPSPLYNPKWQEEDEDEDEDEEEEANRGHLYEDMKRRQQIQADFNDALEEGEAEMIRGRLVLLGRAGVGKTSVINALLGKEFSSEHDITDLLEIHHATIDEDGKWQALDESEIEKHKHYLVALAMEQKKNKKEQTTFEGSEPAAAKRQAEGAIAGTAIQGEVPYQQKRNAPADPLMSREAGPPEKKRKLEELPTEVHTLVQEEKELEKKDSMYVWDFAGQLVYYTVHQLFLTKNTIFLLVADGSRDFKAKIPPEYVEASDYFLMTEKEYLEYFLKTSNIWVKSEKDDSKVRQPCQPPHVFILLNKADLVLPKKLHECLELVRKFVKDTPAFQRMVRKVLPFTSNPAPDNEGRSHLTSYEESCSKLKECIQLVKEDFRVKLPIKWLRLRNKLQEKPHTTYQDAVKIAESLNIEADKVKSVLQYFHQHRELVYWNTKGCRNFIVCQPNWLISEMRKVITVKENKQHESHRNPEVTNLLDLLNDKKILNESLAEELWKENHEVMINIMQKYLLLLPWTKDEYGRLQYLVPCLLETMEDRDPNCDREDIPPIFFVLQDKVMPIGLTSRLVTLLATKKGWRDDDELPTIFFNGAKFFLKEKRTHIDISMEEIVWESQKWKTSTQRRQAVIKVQAKVVSEISQAVIRNTSRCLIRARRTIEEGIAQILSMINVSDQVQTAAESECKHKLQLLQKKSKEEVCNVCRKAYTLRNHGCWYGKKMTMKREDQKQEPAHAGGPVTKARPGTVSQSKGLTQKEQQKATVKKLKDAEPEMYGTLKCDTELLGYLVKEDVIRDVDRTTLKEISESKTRIHELFTIIQRNPIPRYEGFLRALVKSGQAHIVTDILQEQLPADGDEVVSSNSRTRQRVSRSNKRNRSPVIRTSSRGNSATKSPHQTRSPSRSDWDRNRDRHKQRDRYRDRDMDGPPSKPQSSPRRSRSRSGRDRTERGRERHKQRDRHRDRDMDRQPSKPQSSPRRSRSQSQRQRTSRNSDRHKQQDRHRDRDIDRQLRKPRASPRRSRSRSRSGRKSPNR